ncbi:MAG TPA: hypothetical protein VKE69_15255 [Planctomycetota bacterium]|nr:hypothetical protein [Planctomycetota bacterium]
MEVRYDPDVAPAPLAWLALDDDEKRWLVEAFHRLERVDLSHDRLHALAHVLVENQAAEGDSTPIETVIARLSDEGLTRHEAVHAIGAVLVRHLPALLREPEPTPDGLAAYYGAVNSITAREWVAAGNRQRARAATAVAATPA